MVRIGVLWPWFQLSEQPYGVSYIQRFINGERRTRHILKTLRVCYVLVDNVTQGHFGLWLLAFGSVVLCGFGLGRGLTVGRSAGSRSKMEKSHH